MNNHDFNALVSLSESGKSEVTWWLENIDSVTGKPIRPGPIDNWLQNDDSMKDWGGVPFLMKLLSMWDGILKNSGII